MNSQDVPLKRMSIRPKLTLYGLLQLTALIAVGISVGLAYREKLRLERHKASLAQSSPLTVDNEEQFGSARLGRIAPGFQSWDIHVPAGRAYELYLGIGDVALDIIPTIADSVSISSGRHRITLRAQDSPNDEFQYTVYVDGVEKITAEMGRSWLPNGWVRTSGLHWLLKPDSALAPMQIAGLSYTPKHKFGSGREYLMDSSITRRGYRLWIDQADQSYPTPSNLFQLSSLSFAQNYGIRDGLRFHDHNDWQWHFLRPSLESLTPLLRVSAGFTGIGGEVLSEPSNTFRSWQLEERQGAETESSQRSYTVRLRPEFAWKEDAPLDSLKPVVELKWDLDTPDAVGIRLADEPENERISRWSLNFLGKKFLWRRLKIGSRVVRSEDFAVNDGTHVVDIPLSKGDGSTLWWHTDEPLFSQVPSGYLKSVVSGDYNWFSLYDGLPVTHGIRLPSVEGVELKVSTVRNVSSEEAPIELQNGEVFGRIQVEMDANNHDWVWLYAKARQQESEW